MPGDPISIVAAEDSDVVRFVNAIFRLPDGVPDWVLIGGVAVVLRVGGTHRATIDIDTLVRDPNRLVELLLGGRGEQRAARKLIVPLATQLDVMSVGSVPERSSVEPSTFSRWRASGHSRRRRWSPSRYRTKGAESWHRRRCALQRPLHSSR